MHRVCRYEVLPLTLIFVPPLTDFSKDPDMADFELDGCWRDIPRRCLSRSFALVPLLPGRLAVLSTLTAMVTSTHLVRQWLGECSSRRNDQLRKLSAGLQAS